jgi:ubiquinone/menaquinone biosynthesis C-methylase UbiE
MFSVLHHIYDPASVIKEAYRVLKKGGYLYTDHDPNYWSNLRVSSLFPMMRSSYTFVITRFFSRADVQKGDVEKLSDVAEYHNTVSHGFKPEELKNTFLEIGFSDVQLKLHGNTAHVDRGRIKELTVMYKARLGATVILKRRFDLENLLPYIMVIARK